MAILETYYRITECPDRWEEIIDPELREGLVMGTLIGHSFKATRTISSAGSFRLLLISTYKSDSGAYYQKMRDFLHDIEILKQFKLSREEWLNRKPGTPIATEIRHTPIFSGLVLS